MAHDSTSLKDLKNAIPSDIEMHATMMALEAQQHAFSDYAIALIGAGLVEKAIEVAIAALSPNMSNSERKALFKMTLDKKIKLGHERGLFGKKTETT